MKTRTKVVLLAAFVMFDMAIGLGVWRHVNQEPPSSELRVSSESASPSAAKNDSVAGSTQQKFSFKPAESYSISMANDDTVVRALRGSCDGGDPGELAVSTDGGASSDTADTGLREILAVQATSRTELRVVGADASCTVTRLTSTDGGDTWLADFAEPLWYPGLSNDQNVVTPEGARDAGCTVTSLSQVGSSFGRVTCSDGTIRGTGDSGDKWVTLGRLDNVRVATFATFNTGYALAVFQGCAAQEMTTRDGGRTWAKGGCITGDRAQAVDANDTGLVAVVDEEFYVSNNGGKEWSQPK